MNIYAIRVIYKYEMLRAFETIAQSFASPVISTALYFVVFGSASGSRIESVEGISYGAFIVPGLMMLALLTQSIFNASFGILSTAMESCSIASSGMPFAAWISARRTCSKGVAQPLS